MGRPLGSKNKSKDVTPTEVTPEIETSPQEDEAPTAPPAHIKRGALLKEINDLNKERYAASENDEEETEVEVPQDSSEPEETQTPEPTVEATPETPTQTKRKFIVDGVPMEFTDEEITAYVQKHATADQRIREANRILEDAKRSLPTRENERPTTRLPSATSSADDAGGDPEMVSQLTKAILFGEEEQVQEAVSTILKGGRQSTTQSQFSPQQIQGLVAETLAFQRAKDLLETPPEQGGYADIWSDQMLRGMFLRRENELRDGNKELGLAPDSRPYSDLYKSIATELRQWRDDLVKKHTPKTGLENRDQLKRATGIVRGAGARLPSPLESKPKSQDEIISGMRRARGLN